MRTGKKAAHLANISWYVSGLRMCCALRCALLSGASSATRGPTWSQTKTLTPYGNSING